jgi:hypothetical protein
MRQGVNLTFICMKMTLSCRMVLAGPMRCETYNVLREFVARTTHQPATKRQKGFAMMAKVMEICIQRQANNWL